MSYRGSKSIVGFYISTNHKSVIVKEQRVDGRMCFNTRHLRYTLMGFGRNYLVKIPSKQIVNRRFYSSVIEQSLNNKGYNLNP